MLVPKSDKKPNQHRKTIQTKSSSGTYLDDIGTGDLYRGEQLNASELTLWNLFGAHSSQAVASLKRVMNNDLWLLHCDAWLTVRAWVLRWLIVIAIWLPW